MELKIWDKKTDIVYPTGVVADVERVYKDYPWTRDSVVVLEMIPGSNIVGAIDSMAFHRANYGIDPGVSDEEALSQIKYIRENPPEPDPEMAPVTHGDIQALGQQLTEVELLIYENM